MLYKSKIQVKDVDLEWFKRAGGEMDLFESEQCPMSGTEASASWLSVTVLMREPGSTQQPFDCFEHESTLTSCCSISAVLHRQLTIVYSNLAVFWLHAFYWRDVSRLRRTLGYPRASLQTHMQTLPCGGLIWSSTIPQSRLSNGSVSIWMTLGSRNVDGTSR